MDVRRPFGPNVILSKPTFEFLPFQANRFVNRSWGQMRGCHGYFVLPAMRETACTGSIGERTDRPSVPEMR
jgi:hypothetical protein